MSERHVFERGRRGTLICGAVAVGIESDRGVVVTLEHDDFAFSPDEARELAHALTRYADELERSAQPPSTNAVDPSAQPRER